MKVTKIETIRSKEPIPLPEPWLAAWRQPSGKPVKSLGFSFYKVYTDEGIVGIGPNTGHLLFGYWMRKNMLTNVLKKLLKIPVIIYPLV